LKGEVVVADSGGELRTGEPAAWAGFLSPRYESGLVENDEGNVDRRDERDLLCRNLIFW